VIGGSAIKVKGVKWLIAALVVVAVIVAARQLNLQDQLRSALQWIEGLGSWGLAAFLGIYVLACVLFVPGWILTLGAGVLFGLVKGAVLVSVSATSGATVAFLIGRYVARDWVAWRLEGSEKFKAIDEAVGCEGWKIVLLTRLSPMFPFNLLNYAFGLTRISLRHYFFASWIGMLPGTVMYVYLGSLAGSVAAVGQAQTTRTPIEWVFYGGGLLATILVSVYVTRLARRALNQRVQT